MVGRSLSEDERSAELLAVVRGLQAFYSSHGRKAVFPDLSDKLVYGDYNVAGARGHQLLETVTAEINACAHIKSGSWPFKKVESVRKTYVGKIGANVGREDEAVFEAYALEQTRPEAASGSAPLMQRPAEEAADMAVDASPAPLGERPATAHNAGASAASAEARSTAAGCEGETAMGRYLGEYNAAGEFEGCGVFRYANGDVYEGEWKAGLPEGRGVFWYTEGNVESGFYQQNADVGEGVMWMADGRRAKRLLHDRREEEEISLEEARQTAERLGHAPV